MTTMAHVLGGGWDEQLRDELTQVYWHDLMAFVTKEREEAAAEGCAVYPPADQMFRAFELTPYDEVKVVILGQDPYPNKGQAHGLAFSVPSDWKPLPGSLQNIRRVLCADLEVDIADLPEHGSLEAWATQGVLLLNTALTVRDGSKADRESHRKWHSDRKGWTTFTDAVIRAVNDRTGPVVFMLWGNDARRKKKLIDRDRHVVLESSHPSPLSVRRGFDDADHRPFSEANKVLGPDGIDWAGTGI